MIAIEEFQQKVLEELDLSKEVADDELMELIHRILIEDEQKNVQGYFLWTPLKEKCFVQFLTI